MGFNFRRFIDLLLLPLYDFRLKVTIYFRNRQVKAGFGRESSAKHIIFISGVIAGFVLSFLLFWILTKNIPSIIETDKEVLKKMESFPVAKDENEETAEKDEIEVKNEGEVREEKKEDEDAVVASDLVDVADAVVTTPHYMKVLANNVNIRTEPSLESDIIVRLGQGYIAKKLDRQGDWVLADPGNGFKGWIYFDLLEDATVDEHESWENNPNRSAVMGIIRKDLDDPANLETEEKKIKELLHSWKSAWEEKNIEKYMSFYSKAFTKLTYNWTGYKKYKKNIFNRPGAISIEIKNLKVRWENFFMLVSFIQKYQSASISSTTVKMLHFQQEKEGWKIVKETLINSNA